MIMTHDTTQHYGPWGHYLDEFGGIIGIEFGRKKTESNRIGYQNK